MSGCARGKYEVVFVLGGAGAGKGTQCEKIQEVFDFHHVPVGEMLRQERRDPNSQYREEIEKYMKDGLFVPVKISYSLIRREIERSRKNKFIIDGFPRNIDNLDGWNEEMSEVAEVKQVLFFDCPDQVCIDRCIKRGLTSGRSDDNPESMKQRILQHKELTIPVVEHYRDLNLVSTIDANRQPDEVFEDIKKVFMDLGY